MKILENYKIWGDKKHHFGFTDLIKYGGYYWLCFRKAKKHIGENGKTIVLKSKNCKKWKKAYTIKSNFGDLRDPKFLEFKKKLFVVIPVLFGQWKVQNYLIDLKNESYIHLISDCVLWRPKVRRGIVYYPVFYHGSKMKNPNLWEAGIVKHAKKNYLVNYKTIHKGDCANETEIYWIGNKMHFLVRKDMWYGKPLIQSPCVQKINGINYVAYREFSYWGNIKSRIEAETAIASGNINVRVICGKVSSNNRIYEKCVLFKSTKKSGSDSGYPGIAGELNKDEIFVSYYKGTTKKSDIYIARVKI